MDELQLQRLFRALVGPSLVSAVALAACGMTTHPDNPNAGGSGPGGAGSGGSGGSAGTSGSGGSAGAPVAEPFWPDLPLNEFMAPSCVDGRWRPTAGLNPAKPVDYVAWRIQGGYSGSADAGYTPGVLDSTGTPCATAVDPNACQADLAKPGFTLSESCFGPPVPCQHELAATDASGASFYRPGTEYLTFLGVIDTPAEALLLVNDSTAGGYNVACGNPELSSVRSLPDGYQVVATRMVRDCAPIVNERVLLQVSRTGQITVLRSNVASVSSACVGRRTPALASTPAATGSEIADFFAEIAHLEAASVDAFAHLYDELDAHGADADLLDEVERARQDEVRHAALTGSLAGKFGARIEPPRVGSLRIRTLEEIARENAVEGCVRETFGALTATYQAKAARDPEVARAFARIAEDETRHAALAWRIARWAESRLCAEALAEVQSARRRAVAELRVEVSSIAPEALRSIAGVPDSTTSLAWIAALERTLWN